ncbi:MAG: YfhO family protein [Candidatus Firestonebacteria bacterium]
MKKSNYIPLFFLFLVLVLFWFNILFTDKILFYRDTILQFYPWQVFANESINSGCIPLWNPYVSHGAPFLANLQSAVFNPLKLIFYILPYSYALKFFILMNIFLAGLFSFYLAKDLKLSNYASFLTGLIFMLNGYLLTRVEFFSVFSASIWIPLIFLFIKRLFESYKMKYFFLASIFMSLPIFAGSAQIYFYNFIFLLAYILWFSIAFKKNIIKNILIFGGLFIFSICLSMVQILPFVEYVFNSNRGSGLSFETAAHWSLLPSHLINFIFPYFFGDPSTSNYLGGSQFWVISFYIGFLPFVLAIYAIFSVFKKERFVLFLVLTFLFFLILAFGKYTPVYYLLYKYVFPFKLIRYPATLMYINVFILSILAGYGFKNIEKKIKESFRNILIVLFIFSALALLVFYSFGKQIMSNSLFQAAIFSAILIVLCFTVMLKKISLNIFKFLLILLAIFDLFIFGVNLNPLISDKIFFERPKIVDFLKLDKSFFRVIVTPNTDRIFNISYFLNEGLKENRPYEYFVYDVKRILYNNYNMIYKVFNADGYDPLQTKEQDKFMFLLKKQKNPSATRFLDMLNVKYVISCNKVEDKNFKFLIKIDGVNLYENINYLPRVFLVNKVKIAKSNEEALNLIKNNQFIPEKEAIIVKEVEKVASRFIWDGVKKVEENIGTVEIVDYKNEKVVIKADMFKEGMLVFLDSYYPGWKVYIDGKENKILRANYLYRGVYLNKGKHEIKFSYEPITFTIGLCITLISILVLIFSRMVIWKIKI